MWCGLFLVMVTITQPRENPYKSLFFLATFDHMCKTLLILCGCYWVWFFHVSQLLPIECAQRNVCCNSKSTMKHQQKLDWMLDLPLFNYIYHKVHVWWFFLFYTRVSTMFVLWSSSDHTPIKYRCPIKKSNQITPAHLSVCVWFDMLNRKEVPVQ